MLLILLLRWLTPVTVSGGPALMVGHQEQVAASRVERVICLHVFLHHVGIVALLSLWIMLTCLNRLDELRIHALLSDKETKETC